MSFWGGRGWAMGKRTVGNLRKETNGGGGGNEEKSSTVS